MRKINAMRYPFLFVVLTMLSSCEAIGSIFKAGVWSGIILVVVVVAVIIFVIGKLSGGKKD